MARHDPRTCPWCLTVFAPKSTRGPLQKFCCAAHQRKFWGALRRWAFERYVIGEVSIADLHSVPKTGRASQPVQIAQFAAPIAPGSDGASAINNSHEGKGSIIGRGGQ
jgi:hypothetical protein